MSELACPHCGELALSPWHKLVLGWGSKTRCRACKRKVTVDPIPAIIACLPLFLAIVAAMIASGNMPVAAYATTMMILAAIAFAVTCILYLEWVPIVRGEITYVTSARASAVDAVSGPTDGTVPEPPKPRPEV